MTTFLPALLVLATLSAPAPASATAAATAAAPGVAADAPLDKRYGAWVTLDAAGTVTAVDVDAGPTPVIAGVVEGLVKKLVFAPATRAGMPLASGVPIDVGLRFTPDATGGFAAQLRWVRVQPLRATRMAPPRYPSKELRGAVGGWALVGLVVGGGGHADAATVRVLDQGAWRDERPLGAGHASAEAFAAAARDVAMQFTYRTATVDGVPLVVEVAVPMTFQPRVDAAGGSTPLPDFVQAARRPVPAPKLATADIVLPSPATVLPEPPPPAVAGSGTLEVTGSRVSRTRVLH